MARWESLEAMEAEFDRLTARQQEAEQLLDMVMKQMDELPHLGIYEGPVAFNADRIRKFLASASSTQREEPT